jgi:hypothetical protein
MTTVADMYETARATFSALGCGVSIRVGSRVCIGIGQATASMRMDETGGQVRPVTTRRARFKTSDFFNAIPAIGDMIDVISGGASTACEVMFSEIGESGNTIILEWKVSP